MTSREAYKRTLLKANKNDTNEGIYIPIGNFVLMFNEAVYVWYAKALTAYNDNFNINELEYLLKVNIEAPIINKTDEYVEAQLPTDVFRYRASYSLADRGSCTGVRVFNYDKNAANLNPILQDAATGPNFDYEETPCILSEGKLKIYYDDFSINQVLVTYYRKPKQIDIAGYTRIDGSPSTDVDPEFPDEHVNQIINILVTEIERQSRDGDGFQFAKDRENSEE